MEHVLSDRTFQQFSAFVYEQCGINLHEGKKALLQARLNKRLRATGIHSYEDYFAFITAAGHADELVNFLDSVSTNLTYFFRESQHFDFLEQVVLPEIIERKRREHFLRMRFWSAGCSTGEEAYSLAMCVLGRLNDGQKWDFRLLATDISTRVLEVGQQGIYSEERVEKIPPQLRHMYFRKLAAREGRPDFEVAESLRQLVTFRRLNLQEEYPFKGPFDCIFCRNVMIYFDKKTQEKLINRLAHYLAPEGYLFVGHSESLTGLTHPLRYVRPAVYRNSDK